MKGRPVVRQKRKVIGTKALRMSLERAGFNIIHSPGRSFAIALAVASGIALAITIIAASNGVDDKVNSLLNVPQLPSLINLDSIHKVLDQTRDILTDLAFTFTAVLVGIVTWVTMNPRRRDIGIARQHGLHVNEVLAELLIEATILCIVGGLVGIGLGNLLCSAIQKALPLLPMHPRGQDTLMVFPIMTMLSFVTTAIIACYFAVRTYTDVV